MNDSTKSYLLKTDFDQDYDDIGPGILLFSYVVKKVFKKSQVECDFLGEDDDYKLRWTSNCREHTKYYIFGNTLKGKLLYYFEATVIHCLRKVRNIVFTNK